MLWTHGREIVGFAPGGSPLHGLDARTKALALAALAMTATLASSPESTAVTALLGSSAFALSAPSAGRLRTATLLCLGLGVAAVVLNALFTPGHRFPGPEWAPVWPTAEGVADGVLTAGKLVSVALGAMAFVSTTSPREMAAALDRTVGKIRPLRGLGMSVDVALRLIPDLLGEWQRMRQMRAVRTRGLQRSATERIRDTGSLLLPLLVGSIRRSQRLADAMEARCYRGARPRPQRRPWPGAADILVLGVTVGVCALALFYGVG